MNILIISTAYNCDYIYMTEWDTGTADKVNKGAKCISRIRFK